jgi:hypothetical protein
MNEPGEEAGRDEIGMLLDKVLSYRAHCESIWTAGQRLMSDGDARENLDLEVRGREDFGTLDKIRMARKQWGWKPRESRYFWDVLPYQAFELSVEQFQQQSPFPQTDETTQDRNALAACLIARELVQVRRLLEGKPEKWREQGQFEKEQEQADRVWRDARFQADYERLCSEHKPTMDRLCSATASMPLLADFSFLECNPEQDLKDEDDFFRFDLALLCDDYSLEGISQAPPCALPQRVNFVFESTTLVLRLPRYLKVDLNRALPLDVIKMLQVREYAVFSKTPHARSQPWYADIDRKQYVARYYELVEVGLKSSEGLMMTQIYIQLHKEQINDKIPYDDGTRARQGRLLLMIYGIPPSGRDPRVLAIENRIDTH